MGYCSTDLIHRPETSAIQFLGRRTDEPVVGAAEDIYQFTLPRALEDIFAKELGCEVRDAQFLPHLAQQRSAGRLAVIYVPSDGGVPLPGLDILPYGSFLQIDVTCRVEHVQVNDGVQQLAAVVAFAACGGAHNASVFVH